MLSVINFSEKAAVKEPIPAPASSSFMLPPETLSNIFAINIAIVEGVKN